MRNHIIVLSLLAAGLLAGKEPPSKNVEYLPAEQVQAAFAKGVPLIEVEGYKIHASRREGPGMAEVHEFDTDIVHVLEGTATIVTGGEAVNLRMTAPEEFRGASISGGSVRELKPGDVLVIPNGVPHWFRSVSGPFLYYVVKVRANGDRQ